MANLTLAIRQLEQERRLLGSQLERVAQALLALNANARNGYRRMSAAGRARIAAAQRARWAKVNGQKVVSIRAPKRAMPLAARRRIAAAQKARWAKWRRAKTA